jgi:hypothetical protein
VEDKAFAKSWPVLKVFSAIRERKLDVGHTMQNNQSRKNAPCFEMVYVSRWSEPRLIYQRTSIGAYLARYHFGIDLPLVREGS